MISWDKIQKKNYAIMILHFDFHSKGAATNHLKKLSPFKKPLSDEKKQYKYFSASCKKKMKRLVQQGNTLDSFKMSYSYLEICSGEYIFSPIYSFHFLNRESFLSMLFAVGQCFFR